MGQSVTRRIFLRILVVLSALGLTRPEWALAKRAWRSAPDPVALRLGQFFIHTESAAQVGREYLRSVPEEAEASRLVELICASHPGRRAHLIGADRDQLREVLRQQLRQDFEHGRIVKVHGWILSETEARLCALAAISQR